MPPQHVLATAPLLARAAQFLKAGRPGDAIAPLRAAVRLQPDNAAILHDLGVACLESGLRSEAVAALRDAVAANPRFASAFFRLGMALEAQREPSAAIAAYRRAAALLPSLTEAHYRAGNLLEILGHADDAIACFRRASGSGPKTSLGRLGSARALLAEHRDAEAERLLRQVLALDRDNAMALDLLGTVLADAGRFADAREFYARAIAQAPLLAGSYYDLVRCRRITAEDAPLLTQMQAALAEPRLDAGQRVRVHLALAKAADDLGDFARAMGHCDAAEALRRIVAPFDPAAFAGQVDQVVARVTPDLIARAPALGSDDPTPVFVIGLPRSGTTLVEQILSSHKDVAAGGELQFWNERGALWERAGPIGCDAPFLAAAAADCLRRLRAIEPKAKRITDKLPMNVLWAGLIHLALPRATIIHCHRHPIATALSIHQTYFNERLAFPTGGADLVGYVRAYRRLADHWRRVLPAARYIDVEYEALTDAPAATIRRMIAQCGLTWDDACLHPEHNARGVKTASKWQVRQPIHHTSVERWRDYEPWLGPLGALLEEAESAQR